MSWVCIGVSPRRILVRCPNYLNWLISMWRCSGSTFRPSWMAKLLTPSLRGEPSHSLEKQGCHRRWHKMDNQRLWKHCQTNYFVDSAGCKNQHHEFIEPTVQLLRWEASCFQMWTYTELKPITCFKEQERKYELPNKIFLEPIWSLEWL